MEELPPARMHRRSLRRRRFDLALQLKKRQAIQRGLFGESRAWQIVAILIVSRMAIQRLNAPKTVFRARIDPGDRFEIRGFRKS